MHAPTPPDRTHPNGHVSPPAPDAKPQAADGGRDSRGRFGQGNPGGPGNPFARQVAALRAALLARVTAQDLADVAEALLRQAKGGNVAAAKLLLAYAVGKPAAAVDPDTLDLHEWELYRRVPDPAAELAAATQRLGLPVALTYMRNVLPSLADAHADMLLGGLKEMEAKDRAAAEAHDRRAARRQQKPAPQAVEPPSAAAARDMAKALEVLADDPEALAGLFPLLGAPATSGQAVPPPSTNGVSPHGRPGG